MSNDCRCLWSFPCLKKQELPRRLLLGERSAATLWVWNSLRRSCSWRSLMKQQLLRRQQAVIRHTHAVSSYLASSHISSPPAHGVQTTTQHDGPER